MCTIKQFPGKFEGKTCITHLMYAWAGDGRLDMEGCDCVLADDSNGGDGNECGCTLVESATGPFTLDDISDYQRNTNMGAEDFCDECVKDFLAASRIRFWEDTQGFAYSEIS